MELKQSAIQQVKSSFIGNTKVRKLSYKMRYWRWVIISLVAIFLFANYMIMQALGCLQEQVTQTLHTDAKGYNLLQASYSMPNVINPFLAGILIDKIGMRKGYTTFMVIGIIIEYIATTIESYDLMMIGLIFFGLGSEAMCIILTSFVASWFIGKQLSLGLSIMGAAASFGSVLANWALPPLYKKYGTITIPYLVCVIVQIIGFLSTFVMCGIDYKAEVDDKQRKQILQQNTSNQIENNLLIQDVSEIQDQSKVLVEQEVQQELSTDKEEQNKEKMAWKDLKKLNNLMFWLINGVYCFQSAAMSPFSANLQNILLNFYGLDEVGAGRVLSVTTLQVTLITPFFAFLTDKYGRRSECIILSSLILCIQFIIWMYLPVCQEGGCYWFYLPLLVGGFGGCLTGAVIYPTIPLVVDKKVLGSAFGIQDCVQQLGMFLAPLIAGPILQYGQQTSVNSQYWFYAFFLGLVTISLILSVIIYFNDIKTGKRLNAKQGEYEQINKKNKKTTYLNLLYLLDFIILSYINFQIQMLQLININFILFKLKIIIFLLSCNKNQNTREAIINYQFLN